MSAEQSSIIWRDELNRQRAELAPLRSRHAAEIVRCGLAGRMIAAEGWSNKRVGRSNINEGTELTPIRSDLKAMPISEHRLLFMDLENAAASTASDAQDVELLGEAMRMTRVAQFAGYALGVRRLDLSRHEEMITICTYKVGCDLLNGWLKQTEGFEGEDVALLQQQLVEVEELRNSKGLSAINPVTLVQRSPLMIRDS